MPFRRLFRLPWRNASRIRREVDDELRFHLEMRAAELAEAEGMAPEAARAEAARRFGDIEYTRAYCLTMDARKDRSDRRAEMLHELWQDATYALRQLRRSPGFSAVAVLTLALGIGANTAIYSVVNGVLLRPPPYREADRVVRVVSTFKGKINSTSPADFTDWRAQARSFDGLAAVAVGTVNLTGGCPPEAGGCAEPERLESAKATAELFTTVLGVTPIVGRTFAAGEDRAGAPPVVVLGEQLWRSRFGADPAVVGRSVTLDGVAHTVIGVVPRGASYPAGARLWRPLVFEAEWLAASSRGARWLRVVGRTAPGPDAAAALDRAGAEMRAITRRLEELYPDKNTGFSANVVPLHAYTTSDVRRPLLLLMGAVAFVTLIACANVSGLLLARGSARARELAVRSALGAGRGRIVRQLVTESLVLGLLGGLAGLAAAAWGTRAFVAMAPADIPRLDEVGLDGRALAVTAAAALAAGLLFGLLPALHASAPRVAAGALREGRGGGSDRGSARTRSALVVAEVALAVALLAGAGLLVRSFASLVRADAGFRTENAVAFSVDLPDAAYGLDPQARSFTRSLLERVEAIPEVRAAGAVSGMPLTASYFFLSFEVKDRPPAPRGEEPSAVVRFASPGYFGALGVPLVRGRGFTERDRDGAPTVFVINRQTARRYFSGEDPIGKRIQLGWRSSSGARMAGEIVGVVGDVAQFGLGDEPTSDIYVPIDQWPWQDLTVVMRTTPGGTSAAAAAARAIVRELDPNLPVYAVRTLDEVLSESVAAPRFYMAVLGAFAVVAAALAAVGIYGVLSYAVGRRVREIGLRVALGATRARVLGMVVGQGLVLAAAGAALGVGGALWLTRAMAGLLYGVTPTDPLTFAGVVLLFLVVAGVACLLPALRAARVDPAVALRAE